MHLSEELPDDDDVDFSTASLAKLKPYNTDMRDRMIKHATKIKFVKDRYTTPMIAKLSSPLKSGNNTVNVASIHCKIFSVIKILDSSLKLIT